MDDQSPVPWGETPPLVAWEMPPEGRGGAGGVGGFGGAVGFVPLTSAAKTSTQDARVNSGAVAWF